MFSEMNRVMWAIFFFWVAVAWLLTGCVSTSTQVERAATGCLCAGNQCASMVSASGQAAVESAARDTTIGRQGEQPPAAQPKRR